MNSAQIDATAEIVWNRIQQKGQVISSELKQVRRGCTCDEIVAAVGWLARESKLTFESRGP